MIADSGRVGPLNHKKKLRNCFKLQIKDVYLVVHIRD